MQFSMQAVLGLVAALAFIGVSFSCPEGSGCFRYPANCVVGSDCDRSASWRANGNNGIDFTLYNKGSGTDQRWVAIGFSADGGMADSDIMICRQTSGDTAVVEHYWGTLQDMSLVIVKETATLAEDGITNETGSYNNGSIECSFTRAVSVEGKEHVFDLGAENTADMMPKYYYLFGTGPVVEDVPLRHEENPKHSSVGVNYTTTGDAPVGEGSSSESGEDNGASFITYSLMFLIVMSFCAAVFN